MTLAGCGGGGSSAPAPPPPQPPADSTPSFGSATVGDKTYTRGVAIDEETLPEATGGNGTLAYSISPDLPADLSFDASTRVLSGTPAAAQEATTYTYRVTDSDATDPDSATLTFSITVNEPGAAIAASADSVNEWEDDLGIDITVTLDAAAEEDAAVELRMSGTAVAGSDFDLTAADADGGTVVAVDGSLALTIPAGQTVATATLRPIRDLAEEGAESATIAIAALRGAEPPAGGTTSVDVTVNDTGSPTPGEVVVGDFALLFGELAVSTTADAVEITAVLFNDGTVASSATKGHLEARTSSPFDAASSDDDDDADTVRATPDEVDIGTLEAGGDPWEGAFTIPLSSLSASRNYYLALVVERVDEDPEYAEEDRAAADFHVGADGRVRATCTGFDRSDDAGAADPLYDDQWHLSNTGQAAYADEGGIAGEDLHMTEVLASGPTGRGVTVAIVDSGLEICHPDLAPNVEPGLSYNFAAGEWHGTARDDPFLPSLLEGDHGTSVAGIVAMAAENGIGGRGVAPDAGLRGFNLLALGPYVHLGGEYDADARELDALGMSASKPRSDDVDIFNMSYGSAAGMTKLGTDKRNAFKAGVERLRVSEATGDPLGAIYVLAVGNGFGECQTIPDLPDEKERALFLNAELGCVSANLEPEAAWPYVIGVGAFNADGDRSSYSSVGANVWVVAPGGEDAFEKPAIVSADQIGRDRGYDAIEGAEPFGTDAKNPDGDYTYVFGGTSSAAPNAAGAAAVVLSAAPDLTWRDVKHIFAKTARQLDSGIRQTRVAFGGKPAVLQHAWVTNAAGYRFHNHYGFGAIDLDDAVAMARSTTPDDLGPFVQSEPFERISSAEIPDHDGAGVTVTQSVAGLPSGADIEAVQLRFQITHPKPHDLGLTLISPAGTPSVVNHVFNDVLADLPDESVDWELLTNAFYGESPNGEWQLNVIDAATGNAGSLDSWALVIFYGEHPDS